MLLAVVVLQVVILLVLVALLLRGRGRAEAPDARQMQLPDQVLQLHGKHDALEANVRSGLADLRRDHGLEGAISREANSKAFAELRTEVVGSVGRLGEQISAGLDRFRGDNAASASALRTEVTGSVALLGETLKSQLGAFRADNAEAASKLRADVAGQGEAVAHRLAGAATEARGHQDAAREALHTRLTELAGANAAHGEKLRATVGESLDRLNQVNAAKLEEMRATVDEKLHATLQTRLTESFGQVTTHLGEVQKGLGEMKELATGVGDLKKVLSNVKARGVVGEFQLGLQLEQMFSADQYIKNARIKAGSAESVEYALKFPNGAPGSPDASLLLPIDSKFPREDWERLEHAYDHGSAEEIAGAGKAFERAIRTEGKRICEKYIDPPVTMPHAIMFLPTESLYAEVVRRPGLLSDVQQQCRVTIAGPSTFMAILTSFQMGFHTLAIEKKGNDVWRLLSTTKNEFEKFGGLMEKVEKQVGTVQNTLKEISGKTTTINRNLRNVASLESLREPAGLGFDGEFVGQLAASGEP